MSLLTNKLSALPPGSHVRFTHVSGQIIEGVVTENDGKESLSVQITSLATLRYDQISLIDEYQQTGTMQSVSYVNTGTAAETEPEFKVMQVSSDKEAVSQAFKAMETDRKKALAQAHDKYLSYLKSHDESKCRESVDLAWDIIYANKWDFDQSVNLFYGLLLLANKEYKDAAESFFYAGNYRYAYCTAYNGTDGNNKKLYQLAAAFAVIYLLSADSENKKEAAEILHKSSVMAEDISGIEYALKNSKSSGTKEILADIIRTIGRKSAPDISGTEDIDKLTAKLRQQFKDTEIQKITEDFSDRMPETEETNKTDEKEETVKSPEISVDKEYTGRLVKYKFYEDRGTIEADSGENYDFDVNDITDISLQKQVKKITSKNFDSIAVKFRLTKRAGKYVAVSVVRGTEPPKAANTAPAPPSLPPLPVYGSLASANYLYSQKKYDSAIEIYKNHLEGDEFDESFPQIIVCYLAMNNEGDDFGYLEELTAFVDKYVGQITTNTRTLEALQQFYTKVQNYKEAINALNDLMEICNSTEYGRILNYLLSKERCYKALKNYPSAISELLDWLEIVKRNKLKERHQQRDTVVYVELADLYFESGDQENAEKYIGLSASTERSQALKSKIEAKKEELKPDDDESDYETEADDTDYSEDNSSEPEESLQTAYEYYTDTAGFDAIGKDDISVINTALNFRPDQLHCLLTYLNSAALISASSKMVRTDENGETVYVGQAIKTVNEAVAYAFNSPLLEYEYLSSEIIAVFNEAKRYIPEIAPSLLAASAIYELFGTPSIPDYNTEELAALIEESQLSQYPALLPLINDLRTFYENTGYGMDSFAGYKTNGAAIEDIIAEAKECCKTVDMRNEVFESQGQVRRLREFMFSSDESELRRCLNYVAANETERYQYIKNTISDLFIRTSKPASADNIDIKKLEKYIDRYWDRARDVIQDEGRHIARPHDKIKGSKRNNIITSLRRILSCICDWLAAAEHSGGNDNKFAQEKYDQLVPKVTSELSDIIKCCIDISAEKGFDWGTESIRKAADELLAKINGSFSSKKKHYFFIDFLRGEDILLDDNYLPEIQSTFCDMQDFNILDRIEHHASVSHPELHERISEILSNTETKHNFRTARLIRAYGEDTGNKAIIEHKDMAQYNDCLKQAKQRFEPMFQDFSDELELYENYGTLSNINGEKNIIAAVAYSWYKITRITNDYGFYARLLESIRSSISANASRKGETLMHQLEDLSSNAGLDFGVFSKEIIEEKINDQNYSSAEFIMSCILRGDVSAISDYSDEPFGYFGEFINENATNSRAVRGAGKDITSTIYEYSGKKDLEKALIVLTNNARKETKGGANLLRSWLPVGGLWASKGGGTSEEHLEKLLQKLGFKPVSIQRDNSVEAEAYQVFCRKQTGKVNYVHQIPAFGSKSETEGFRLICLYGKYDCDMLMDKFRAVNATAKHTLVLLDFAMNIEERRRLARKIKEEKSFAKTFIVIDRVVLFYLAKHYAENTVIRRLMAVTLPFAYYQPFVEASRQDMPPELFTGREAELTSIESPEGANLVYGGRQLGKSALLKMAKHNIDRNANGDRAVLIDIKDLTAAEAAPIVCEKLIIEGILDPSCQCDTWTTLAGHLQKRLMDENPETRINYLLLMLDEADAFIKTSGETNSQPITALKSLPPDKFKLVMAGLHNLSRYNREMMHANSNLIHLTPIIIKQFRREEATKLLTSILAYLGFRFTQNIIDNILASTYNYPGLIQFYCQKLLEAMKNEDYAGYGESATPPYEVTESHYKKVLSDTVFTDKVNEKLEATLFTEEKGHSNYHIIALIIAFLCYSAPDEKGHTTDELLKIAVDYHINRITSLNSDQLSEILNEMCDLNVITVMDGYYRFSTDGFRKLLGSQEKVEKSIADYFEEDAVI